MAWNLGFLLIWCMLTTCINTESRIPNEKRLLLTDPDYANNQQMQRDIQLLTATVNQLQTTVNTLNAKVIIQDKQITTFQNSKYSFKKYFLSVILYGHSDMRR